MERFLTRNHSKAACPSGYTHVKVDDNLFCTRGGVDRCLNPVGLTVTAPSQHPHCHLPSPICCGLQTLSEHRSAHAPSHPPGALSLPAAPGLQAGDSCPSTSPPSPGLLSLLLSLLFTSQLVSRPFRSQLTQHFYWRLLKGNIQKTAFLKYTEHPNTVLYSCFKMMKERFTSRGKRSMI